MTDFDEKEFDVRKEEGPGFYGAKPVPIPDPGQFTAGIALSATASWLAGAGTLGSTPKPASTAARSGSAPLSPR